MISFSGLDALPFKSKCYHSRLRCDNHPWNAKPLDQRTRGHKMQGGSSAQPVICVQNLLIRMSRDEENLCVCLSAEANSVITSNHCSV